MLMYMVVVWWPGVCLATVRADLGHLQRLAQVSITESVSTALMDTLQVLLSLLPFHLVTKAEAKAFSYGLSGIGM
jgi:hypothetical protein